VREFELIHQIQQALAVPDPSAAGVELGIGDDAAVLAVPAGQHLVAATDTLNAGVHFPADTAAQDIAHKCLAVNLSDLAAMGATPRWALLSLSLPQADPQWLESFILGFKTLAQAHGVALVGGDTTAGPLSVCVTALGVIAQGRQLLRSGAQAGDLLLVSGTIGGAARVLELLRGGQPVADRQLLDRPQPRVGLGRALAGFASACIDISDGLLADLGHVLKASGCGARIELARLPYANILADLDQASRWNCQLSGGDDYELLFTLPGRHEPLIANWQRRLGIDLSVIGQIEEPPGIRCVTPRGEGFDPLKAGFEHFGCNA
jgi:thiamine-monophosphate kinase